MNRVSLLVLASLLLLAGCDTFSSDNGGITIETDKQAYILEHKPGIYTTPVVVKITNNNNRNEYLGRRCGFLDTPARSIERVANPEERIELDIEICPLILLSEMPPPFLIKAGKTYEDVFNLESLEQLAASPMILPEIRTGTFRFRYAMSFVKTMTTDGRPEERDLVSNSFTVGLQ